MKKRTAIIYLCFIGGCILIGIVVGGTFREETNQQPRDYSAKKLTDEEKAEVIKIALDDASVKEMLKGKAYKVSGALIMSGEKGERGKRVSWTCPATEIYIGEDDWTRITLIHVLVDLNKKEVVDILETPAAKPVMLKELTEEKREDAKIIALSNKSVKEMFEGLEYRIAGVFAFENLKTGEKGIRVYMYINGTAICFATKVNLSEKRVTEISESNCGDKVGKEKSAKAIKIALNDSRVKDKMNGRDYAATARQKLIEKRLLVDVYIEMEEPPMTYIATVDPEEGKVIEIGEK